jgi:hypothetical protein
LAQKAISIFIITQKEQAEEIKFWKHINQKYIEKDSLAVNFLAKEIQNKAITKGFVTASYQIEWIDSCSANVLFKLGKPYKWVNLSINPLYRDILYKAGYKSR